MGSGILVSLKALFPQEDFDLPTGREIRAWQSAAVASKPAKPGSYAEGAIILLTDGQTTAGPDPVDAARLAAERGVRVFTVGVGTDNGQILTGEGWSMRVRLDEEPLKADRRSHARRVLLRRHRARPEEGLRVLALEAGDGEEARPRSPRCSPRIAAAAVLLSATLSLLWFNRVL